MDLSQGNSPGAILNFNRCLMASEIDYVSGLCLLNMSQIEKVFGNEDASLKLIQRGLALLNHPRNSLEEILQIDLTIEEQKLALENGNQPNCETITSLLDRSLKIGYYGAKGPLNDADG